MKNVYLYMVFLLIGFSGFGQDLQNANWLFGANAWVNFSTTSPSYLTGSAMNINEGGASVSDENGNLLFYTDGMSVWNKNHQKMPNGINTLNGYSSNSQGAIIVPMPGYEKKYYIFTIDGDSGNEKGLYYSIVDMTNGLGQVVSLNNKMKNHNGVYIDNTYGNKSEKLTSTTHKNGKDYWVVTQIEGYVYSYKVSEFGIGVGAMPDSYTVAPVDLVDRGNGFGSPGIGNVKISPNNQRIVIGYESKVRSSDTDTYAYGALVTGTFNNSTGEVSLNPLQKIDNRRVYGLEFSPNSQNIYFTSPFPNQTSTCELLAMNINSNYYSIQSISGPNMTGALQRARNGKIYMTKFGGNTMSVINTPDNYSSPDFQLDSVNIGLSATNNFGLPQWVHWQETCPSDLILTSTVFDVLAPAQDNRQASNTITASNKINNGAIGIYHADYDVVLKHGFSSANGSVFRAYIEGCSNEFVGLRSSSGEEESFEVSSTDMEPDNYLFALYPNPATENVTVTSGKVIQNISVTSTNGLTLFQRDIKANSYELNISSYSKGLYVITVTTEDGEMEMKKLIKE
ncbi:3-coathanger stack domain-containing protein [Flavobacterium suzhouense]|uniref:3-coathanger stack domain-containing protein n=1 Tax=Flavobacterium suzhouense TaxID=1529638 RepID=A0ABW5NU73_9FLAO